MGLFDDLKAGTRLDHFLIESQIAESGMATVFRARDERDGRMVAIKVPHGRMEADPVLYERFRREEEIGTRLQHPNVMAVYAEPVKSRMYMVMELCEGQLLRNVLHTEGKLSQERARAITLAILHALEYIHREGVVHRDLKPENIMVAEDGSVKLIDFGVAWNEGSRRLTYAGFTQTMGSPDYIAPEQVKGKRGDGRSDVFAVGVMLYEMLSGRKPFRGDTPLALMNDRLLNHPTPPHVAEISIGPQMQEVIYRALERDPLRRYSSAREFAWDLENLEKVGVEDRVELREWRVRKTGRRRMILLYTLIALVPFLLVFLMLAIVRHR